jgi:enamine deaminase RidA (YjgF/YER057c/UK114 family)
MSIKILQPPNWPRPNGYSPGVLGDGRQVYVSGQLGCNEQGIFAFERFSDQVRVALRNVLTVLAQAGAGPQHIAKLTWFVVDCAEYHAQQKEAGIAYRDVMGSHYPAMSLVQVAGLVAPQARVEIEAVAVLPLS